MGATPTRYGRATNGLGKCSVNNPQSDGPATYVHRCFAEIAANAKAKLEYQLNPNAKKKPFRKALSKRQRQEMARNVLAKTKATYVVPPSKVKRGGSVID